MIRRELRVSCAYDQIPSHFDIDVSKMNIGDMIKASEIPMPDGVQVVYDHDFNVLTLYGKQAVEVEVVEEEEPEAVSPEQE